MPINQTKFPKYLLDNVCWDFTGQDEFPAREEFEEAVKQYNLEAFEDDEDYNFDEEFNFQEIVLESSFIIVNYYADPLKEEEGFHLVEIKGDNGISFSNGELLYKFHNAAVNRLKDSGHCYLEGLEFTETDEKGRPVYKMIGGS